MKCYMELAINLNRKWHIGIVFHLFFFILLGDWVEEEVAG